MSVPAGYKGAKVEIVERDIKNDQTQSFIERTLKKLPKLTKVGIFTQDKDDGDLTEVTKSKLQKAEAVIVDMKDFVDTANNTKTASELNNLKTSAAFTDWTFKRIVNEVETILENDKLTKHSAIQKKIEGCLNEDEQLKSFTKNYPGINTNFLEYPIPVLIQSGSSPFTVNKFQVESSDENLVSQAIYINVCSKFSDMCSMASRTLLVNPKEEQKQAYLIANEALDTLSKSLKVGKPISDAYVAAKNLMDTRKEGLNYQSNFGFGIGA